MNRKQCNFNKTDLYYPIPHANPLAQGKAEFHIIIIESEQ